MWDFGDVSFRQYFFILNHPLIFILERASHLPELLFILDAPNLLAQSIGEQVVSGQTGCDPGDGVGSASGCIPPRVRVALL